MRGRLQRFSVYPLSSHMHNFPLYQHPPLSTSVTRMVYIFTKGEPTVTYHSHPKVIVYFRVHSWCCPLYFTALKIFFALPIHLFPPPDRSVSHSGLMYFRWDRVKVRQKSHTELFLPWNWDINRWNDTVAGISFKIIDEWVRVSMNPGWCWVDTCWSWVRGTWEFIILLSLCDFFLYIAK